VVLASVCLLASDTASAEPISIELLSATFTTQVATWTSLNATPHTRETTSSTPLSDSLLAASIPNPAFPWIPSFVGAIAETDFFRVHANTATLPSLTPPFWSALSVAKTELMFSPLTSATTTIGLTLTTAGSNDFWSEGTMSLYDVTANQYVWNHGWDATPLVDTQFGPPEYGHLLNGTPLNLGPLHIDTAFDLSHQYRLTLYTLTHAQNDRQNITLEVSGLHVVPEPSTLWLVGIGVAVSVGRHRRR
jgi:hypothetical protein